MKEAQERQEKRQQAKAERFAAENADENRRQTEQPSAAAGLGAAGAKGGKKPLVCNTCGLTFADTVRTGLSVSRLCRFAIVFVFLVVLRRGTFFVFSECYIWLEMAGSH